MVQLKTINLKKYYPMQNIVSTDGTPPYGISKYLVNIIQPTINKNNNETIQHLFTKPKNGQLIPKKYKYPKIQ